MFNIWSQPKSVKEINNLYPTWTWTTSIKDADGNDVPVSELISKYNTLLKENKDYMDLLKSIEQDGTKEHNAALELRQENAKLKLEIIRWKTGAKHWKDLYDEKADTVDELVKEVNGLRHLKKENVELVERVNEIDSDVNRDLQDQLFTLKNDYAVLKNRNTELLEKYNGFVTMGGLKYMEAKLQIVQNNYKKCSQERDEFKHQLNAANKENEELKKRIDGLSLAIDRKNFEVDECKTSFENMRKAYEQEAKSANKELEKRLELEKEYEVRLKELNNGLVDVTRENKKFCKIIEDQKAEIEKLKKDIVDYVFEKDNEIEKLKKELNHMKAVAEGAINLCDLSDKTDYDLYSAQKHPMYPIHWGGYDKDCSAYSEKKQKEVEFDAEELLKRTTEFTESLSKILPNESQKEKKWICPCNVCKIERGEM